MSGVEPKDFRTIGSLRTEIAAGLGKIESQLTPLVVNAPRRRILRLNKNGHTPTPHVAGTVAPIGVAS